ncbi:MAG TPA: amidohydrolase family protein [Candidatus Polarisedimenticolia bacterium]|nr:amidohydrolase family protein [Candidatus Polarisedimenticolia bacterium]
MARWRKILGAGMAAAAMAAPAGPAVGGDDLTEARALFERNLAAIRARDRDAYLACYLDEPGLARTGPGGTLLGFETFAAQAGEGWPDRFEGLDLRLVPVKPGVVYGSYRYRVRYGGREDSGLSERLFVRTRAGWRIAMTSAFPALEGTPPPPRALAGATLVDGTGRPPVPGSVVLIRDGRIECAGPRAACPIPPGVETLDVSGSWIVPGLIDAHVHFSQTGWADGRPDALDLRSTHPYEAVQARLRSDPGRFLRAYLCSGVTAVFDVGGYPWTWGLPGRTERDTLSPRVSAAGPLLSTRDHWLNLPAERQFIHLDGAGTAAAGVRYLAEHGAGAVKVWYIVEQGQTADQHAPAVKAAGEEARRLGLPLIVHATGLDEAKEALRAGATLLVHSVWDKPVDDEFLDLARANRAVYCPTLVVRDGYMALYRAALSGQPPPLDDPRGCVDPATRDMVADTAPLEGKGPGQEALDRRAAAMAAQAETMAANLRRVRDAGITIAMGTDAGNPLTLHGPSVFAEMEAMERAGMTPRDVLIASTRGGAAALGRLDELGTVEAGKLADLLVVSSDPGRSIAALRDAVWIVRGGVVRSTQELSAPGR